MITTTMDSTPSIKFKGSTTTNVNYNIKTKNNFEILNVEETKAENYILVRENKLKFVETTSQTQITLRKVTCKIMNLLWKILKNKLG